MHAHHHAHGPAHGEHGAHRRQMSIALGITTVFFLVEAIGGYVSGSLALLADAGHMLTDVAALSLSLWAMWLAERPSTSRRSFGYRRVEILAALGNATLLIVISVFIFWEALQRLMTPPEVQSGLMLAVAVAGLIANAASARVLMHHGGHEHNLNTRGAFLHVVSDMLGSAGAILAAGIMLHTGWYLADPILSAGIGLLILWSAWRLLRESVDVLLEATPAMIDADDVRQHMLTVSGVLSIHDLHIWTVTSGFVALSCHVDIVNERSWTEILRDLASLLRDEFEITHITVQPEIVTRLTDTYAGCSADSPEGSMACQTVLPNI